MNEQERHTPRELKSSLNLVIVAVTFGMTMFTVINGPILTAYTRAIGAGDFVYAVIMAMPVLGAVIQVFASFYMESTGVRKKMFLTFGFVHRLIWIPVGLVPFFIPREQTGLRILVVTLLIAVASSANSIVAIAFNSWMGDLVPVSIRGRFFSKRTMIYTISSAVTSLAAGKFVDMVPGFPGYGILLCVVAIFGATDIAFFFWIKDPPMTVSKDRMPFLEMFTGPFKNKNYVMFILFVSFWYFATNFAGPFFNVFMLEHLKMKVFAISLCTQVISSIATILFIRVWGRIVDKFGNKPVMLVCSIVIILLPFSWVLITPQNYWYILIINFFGGILWPGFELTAMNMSIWLAPEKNRSMYIANYTLILNVVGTAAAFLCGGAFMEFVGPSIDALKLSFLFGEPLNRFHVLFLVSGTLRLIVLTVAFRNFKEENSKSAGEMLRSLNSGIRKKIGIGS